MSGNKEIVITVEYDDISLIYAILIEEFKNRVGTKEYKIKQILSDVHEGLEVLLREIPK